MKDWKVLEVKDATTPEEMRAELFRLSHYDHLVQAVWRAADYRGMSTEDRYSVMAYEALKARNAAQAQCLEFAICTLRPTILPSNASLSGLPLGKD